MTKDNDKAVGIHALYAENPEKADLVVFDRTVDDSRRGFLTGLGKMTTLIGAPIVFSHLMPGGLIPAAFAATNEGFELPGKEGLRVLNDKPINAETPAHLLNDDFTPAKYLFVRNNGIPPQKEAIDADKWTLTISGESAKQSKTYTLKELKEKFENIELALTLECGGNGRSEFFPPAKGNQWSTGAVGCPIWNGVRLKDVLEDCGVKDDAVYIGYKGSDSHLSLDPNKDSISRGVPIAKALDPYSIIAWGMNGEDLPLLNGYPLRLVFAGYPASTGGKWLNEIMVRNIVHDGVKMGGTAYRMPCETVAPGTKVADENMCIIEAMPIKSLVTSPESGVKHPLAESLKVHGHAWAGELEVAEVHVSIDFGQTWQKASVSPPRNKSAWVNFDADVTFPQKGYYEVWAKATDSNGVSQPMVIPGWNPKGYLNNACHRVAVYAV